MKQHNYEYDAFISHAVEDKIPIANELCAKLENAGLRIWYSGKELGIGDSIEKTIEKGLNRSRYGVVIFSPTYLAKNWTIREFYTLLAKEIEEHKVILPVLYNVTLDDLKKKDLVMADRFGVNADKGIDFVVDKLVKEIRKGAKPKPKAVWLSRIWVALFISLLSNCFLLSRSIFASGDDTLSLTPTTTSGLMHEGEEMIPEFSRILQEVALRPCNHQDHSNDHHGYPKELPISGVSRYNGSVTMAVILQFSPKEQEQQQVERSGFVRSFSSEGEVVPAMLTSFRGVRRIGGESAAEMTTDEQIPAE